MEQSSFQGSDCKCNKSDGQYETGYYIYSSSHQANGKYRFKKVFFNFFSYFKKSLYFFME